MLFFELCKKKARKVQIKCKKMQTVGLHLEMKEGWRRL